MGNVGDEAAINYMLIETGAVSYGEFYEYEALRAS